MKVILLLLLMKVMQCLYNVYYCEERKYVMWRSINIIININLLILILLKKSNNVILILILVILNTERKYS